MVCDRQMPAHPSFPLYGLRPLSALIRNQVVVIYFFPLLTTWPPGSHQGSLPERSSLSSPPLLPKLRLTPLLPLSQATAGCPVKSLSQAPPRNEGSLSVAGVLVLSGDLGPLHSIFRVLVGSLGDQSQVPSQPQSTFPAPPPATPPWLHHIFQALAALRST